MRLSHDTVLHAIAKTLRDQVSPALSDPYVIDVVRMAANQLTIVANAYDDSAALRVAENSAIRAIFRNAADIVLDPKLAAGLREVARSSDPAVTISSLDTENGRLRALLVELHAHVERGGSSPLSDLDQDIWDLLRQIEENRAPRI